MAKQAPTGAAGTTSLTLELKDLATDAHSVLRLRRKVFSEASTHPGLILDLSKIERPGPGEIAVLARLASEAKARRLELKFSGLQDGLAGALGKAVDVLASPEAGTGQTEPLLEMVGEEALRVAADFVTWRRFVTDALTALYIGPLKGKPWRWDAIIEQIDLIGVQGTPIVVFISLLVGAVLALNGAYQLRQFGALIFTANLVGVAMTREMGPLMTAVIIAGRSGSAIAAELGTMVVAEEIDAMKTMGLPPSRHLLVPRLVGLLVTMPCLTVLSDIAGIFGGYLVGTAGMGLGSANYWHQTVRAVLISDLLTGLVKSAVFATLIGLVSSYEGLQVSGGARGVGSATTRAVVNSIVAAIGADAVFTLVFYLAR